MKQCSSLCACAAVMQLAGCKSYDAPVPEPAQAQKPVSPAEVLKQRKVDEDALWTRIRKEMGSGWFEKTESVHWNGMTIFGDGVSRYKAATVDAVAPRVLTVSGPFFAANDGENSSFPFGRGTATWSSSENAKFSVNIMAEEIECTGAFFARFNKPYPWTDLAKAADR